MLLSPAQLPISQNFNFHLLTVDVQGVHQTKRDKIQIGYDIPTFLGAHEWAEVLHNPYILRVPRQRGTKSKLAASPMPSRGPTSGRKCYITPAFSGVPKQRGTKSELAASPLPSRGP